MDSVDVELIFDKNAFGLESSQVPVNMRIDSKSAALIEAAAEILGVDRMTFILDAACRRAEELTLDRTLSMLSDNAFEQFERALEDNSASSNWRLKALLSASRPWS